MDEHPQLFEVTQDAKRRFHWMLYADGGVIAQSRKEGYATHEECLQGIRRLIESRQIRAFLTRPRGAGTRGRDPATAVADATNVCPIHWSRPPRRVGAMSPAPRRSGSKRAPPTPSSRSGPGRPRNPRCPERGCRIAGEYPLLADSGPLRPAGAPGTIRCLVRRGVRNEHI